VSKVWRRTGDTRCGRATVQRVVASGSLGNKVFDRHGCQQLLPGGRRQLWKSAGWQIIAVYLDKQVRF